MMDIYFFKSAKKDLDALNEPMLSLIVRRPTFEDMVFEEGEMTPDEAEAFAEHDAAIARGEQLVPYRMV